MWLWCDCGAPHSWICLIGPNWATRTATTWTFSGADDGIRTRDPHLGRVILFVHRVRPSPLACESVHPVSIESAQIPACCRAVYYEPTMNDWLFTAPLSGLNEGASRLPIIERLGLHRR